MQKEIKMIKVRRIKEKKEEPKKENVKIVKVRRTKPPILEQELKKIKLYNFKKDCKTFMSKGICPDDYIEKTVNEIAFLYFYSKNIGLSAKELKQKLKDTDYYNYMEVVMTLNPSKMDKLGISRKVNNGNVLLYNILKELNIEKDKNIKTPYPLIELRNMIYRNSFTKDYYIDSPKRVYTIKEDDTMKTFKDPMDILKDTSLKSCTVMIEYENCKFIAIPYKQFKKLSEIKYSSFDYYTVLNPADDNFNRDEFDSKYLMTMSLDEIVEEDDNVVYFGNSSVQNNFISLIKEIVYYEDFWHAIDDYNKLRENMAGVFCGRERVSIELKNGEIKEYFQYTKFIREYFPFLSI